LPGEQQRPAAPLASCRHPHCSLFAEGGKKVSN
jgi:hypothetical protein